MGYPYPNPIPYGGGASARDILGQNTPWRMPGSTGSSAGDGFDIDNYRNLRPSMGSSARDILGQNTPWRMPGWLPDSTIGRTATSRGTDPAPNWQIGLSGRGVPGRYLPGGQGGGSSGGYNDYDDEAARMAAAARKQALGDLKAQQNAIMNSPLMKGATGFYQGVLSGNQLPYTQAVQDRLYSRQGDQIAGQADVARERAYQRAGTHGLGRGAALADRERAIESNASGYRRGALSDIQNTAATSNFAAQQSAAAGAGGLLGTAYGLTNPLVQTGAKMKMDTQYRGGVSGSSRSGSSSSSGRRNPRSAVQRRVAPRHISTASRGDSWSGDFNRDGRWGNRW